MVGYMYPPYILDTMMKPYEDHLPNSISMKALIMAFSRLALSVRMSRVTPGYL